MWQSANTLSKTMSQIWLSHLVFSSDSEIVWMPHSINKSSTQKALVEFYNKFYHHSYSNVFTKFKLSTFQHKGKEFGQTTATLLGGTANEKNSSRMKCPTSNSVTTTATLKMLKQNEAVSQARPESVQCVSLHCSLFQSTILNWWVATQKWGMELFSFGQGLVGSFPNIFFFSSKGILKWIYHSRENAGHLFCRTHYSIQ